MENSQARTYDCTRQNTGEKLVFTASKDGIRFTEWTSAFDGCEMDTAKTFPAKMVTRKNIPQPYRPLLRGANYVVEYTWYYTTQYYLSFKTPMRRHNAGDTVALEVNGDDSDGCFLYNYEFACQVK
jgi:hypothetical protein